MCNFEKTMMSQAHTDGGCDSNNGLHLATVHQAQCCVVFVLET